MTLGSGIGTPDDLAEALRRLRRREARRQGQPELTYRELAAKTGWSVGIIGAYLNGKAIPPTDRFDILVALLGATPAEIGMLASGVVKDAGYNLATGIAAMTIRLKQ